MQKIPTIFERDWEGDKSRVLDQVVSGCEWVLEGEGVCTRKYDGTCVMLDENGKWWSRRDTHEGKPVPDDWFSTGELDPETGKTPGFEPVEQSPFAKFHAEALKNREAVPEAGSFVPGTHELIGPKINKNPEHAPEHVLIPHDKANVYEYGQGPWTFNSIEQALKSVDWEGFVFHHPDGRMARIKKRDFGIKR